MDCVIAAGGIPTTDSPLYPYTQGKPKSLIDMGGRTMLERIVDALQASHNVDDVIIVGIDDDQYPLNLNRKAYYIHDHGSMIRNFKAGLDWISQHKPASKTALLCSNDIPHITEEIIDDFVERCQPFDYLFYYPYVEKEVVERRYPNPKHPYEVWTIGEFLAGDIFMVNMEILNGDWELWEAWDSYEWNNYPAVVRQITEHFGAETLHKLLSGQFSYEEEFDIIKPLLGSDKGIKIVLSPYAELALDADYTHIIERLQAEFINQS